MIHEPRGNTVAGNSFRTVFPQSSLLLGPHGVGKHLWALWALQESDVHPLDVLDLDPVTMEGIRQAQVHVQKAPQAFCRAVVLNLDSASPQALHGLLKLLEEPPHGSRIVCTASKEPMPTILSRVFVFRFSLLSTDDVSKILQDQGLPEKASQEQALLSGGRMVSQLSSTYQTSRAQVASLALAIRERDKRLVIKSTTQWNRETHDLLKRLCSESVGKTPQVFTEEDLLPLPWAIRILSGMFAQGHPRLVVRSLVLEVLK